MAVAQEWPKVARIDSPKCFYFPLTTETDMFPSCSAIKLYKHFLPFVKIHYCVVKVIFGHIILCHIIRQ